jgi:Phosphotransferase enzyme family
MTRPTDALFHLLIFDKTGRSVLVEEQTTGFLLPLYCGTPRSRVPVFIHQLLCSLQLKGFIGGMIVPESDPVTEENIVLWVATGNEITTFAHGFKWVKVEDGAAEQSLLPFQRSLLSNRSSWCMLPRCNSTVANITEWVGSAADASGKHLTGEFSQLRAGGRRLLLRFAAGAGSPVYYLAGTKVSDEANFVAWLSRYCPDHFPRTVAQDRDASRWLIDSVPGEPLSKCLTLDNCTVAASELAALQIGFLGLVPDAQPSGGTIPAPRCLVGAPERDFRLGAILGCLERDFEALRDTCQCCELDTPFLCDSVLKGLRRYLIEAAALEIPNTFVHFDATPPNVFLQSGHMRLIDFDIAGWGFPFLTLETLLMSEELLVRRYWHDDLKEAFSRPWLDVLTARQVKRAAELAPIIRLWLRVTRLLRSPFQSEPERYWQASFYRFMLAGFTSKLVRAIL